MGKIFFDYNSNENKSLHINYDVVKSILPNGEKLIEYIDRMIYRAVKDDINIYLVNFSDIDHFKRFNVEIIFDNRIYYKPVEILNNDIKPSVYLVDIDGTLSDRRNRKTEVWHKGEDIPISHIVELVKKYDNVIISTGRNEKYKNITEQVLKKWGIKYNDIYMRGINDARKDWEIKEDHWKEITEKYHIKMIIDDKTSVIERATTHGFNILKVIL